MRNSIFMAFVFAHLLCWSQMAIPPNDPTSHSSYAAYLDAARVKNNYWKFTQRMLKPLDGWPVPCMVIIDPTMR